MTVMQRQGVPGDSQLEPKRLQDSPPPSPKPAKILRSEEERGGDELGEESQGDGRCQPLESSNMSQNTRVQRYLVAVEYVGTRFSGSQQQPNCRTVVGVLEDAFQKFIGQPVSIFCSSRTLPPHEPGVVKRAVNHFLRKDEGDISVVDVRLVPGDFHARFKAQERTYFYRLLSGREPLSVFEKEQAWHVPEDLDIHAMLEACQVLMGSHDFSSFRAAGCQANSPIRTLDELHVCEVPPSLYFPSNEEREKMRSSRNSLPLLPEQSQNGEDSSLTGRGQRFGARERHRCYVITARARSFLYHQVRLLVGVLKSIGTGQLAVADVKRILDAKTVTAAPPMAPACGLYLGNVKYDLL